jgi:hypothetical protein
VNAAASPLTAEFVRQLVRYEPETGKLFWLPRPRALFQSSRSWKTWNSRFSSTEAFTAYTRGYRHGVILGQFYKAHRVIWLIQTGEWPEDCVDHANGVRDDNRWRNLRAATHHENQRNKKRQARNANGMCGVRWIARSRKWQARIGIDGRSRHLGYFATVDEALRARAEANAAHGFSTRHGREAA